MAHPSTGRPSTDSSLVPDLTYDGSQRSSTSTMSSLATEQSLGGWPGDGRPLSQYEASLPQHAAISGSASLKDCARAIKRMGAQVGHGESSASAWSDSVHVYDATSAGDAFGRGAEAALQTVIEQAPRAAGNMDAEQLLKLHQAANYASLSKALPPVPGHIASSTGKSSGAGHASENDEPQSVRAPKQQPADQTQSLSAAIAMARELDHGADMPDLSSSLVTSSGASDQVHTPENTHAPHRLSGPNEIEGGIVADDLAALQVATEGTEGDAAAYHPTGSHDMLARGLTRLDITSEALDRHAPQITRPHIERNQTVRGRPLMPSQNVTADAQGTNSGASCAASSIPRAAPALSSAAPMMGRGKATSDLGAHSDVNKAPPDSSHPSRSGFTATTISHPASRDGISASDRTLPRSPTSPASPQSSTSPAVSHLQHRDSWRSLLPEDDPQFFPVEHLQASRASFDSQRNRNASPPLPHGAAPIMTDGDGRRMSIESLASTQSAFSLPGPTFVPPRFRSFDLGSASFSPASSTSSPHMYAGEVPVRNDSWRSLLPEGDPYRSNASAPHARIFPRADSTSSSEINVLPEDQAMAKRHASFSTFERSDSQREEMRKTAAASAKRLSLKQPINAAEARTVRSPRGSQSGGPAPAAAHDNYLHYYVGGAVKPALAPAASLAGRSPGSVTTSSARGSILSGGALDDDDDDRESWPCSRGSTQAGSEARDAQSQTTPDAQGLSIGLPRGPDNARTVGSQRGADQGEGVRTGPAAQSSVMTSSSPGPISTHAGSAPQRSSANDAAITAAPAVTARTHPPIETLSSHSSSVVSTQAPQTISVPAPDGSGESAKATLVTSTTTTHTTTTTMHIVSESGQPSTPISHAESESSTLTSTRSSSLSHSTDSGVASEASLPFSVSPLSPPSLPFLESRPAPPETGLKIKTDATRYVLITSLPGFRLEFITLATKNRTTLQIVADKWDSKSGGHFERRITFSPDADLRRTTASFDGTELTILVPRKPMPAQPNPLSPWSVGTAATAP